MSFSQDVKKEIARQLPDDYHCLIAELAAMIRFAGEASPAITLETENIILAKKYLRLIRKAFDIPVNLNIKKLSKSNVYRIVLSGEAPETLEASSALQLGDGLSRVLAETANWQEADFAESLLEYDCCKRAFLRGAFLAVGSMSNPGKSYHFELVCRKTEEAAQLCDLLAAFGIEGKTVGRKNKCIVYIKDSEAIVDVLGVMGATGALLELENVRIIKEMKNSVNRQMNCDDANINKVIKTATRQVEDIRLLQQTLGLESLPPLLKEMAPVRLAPPEKSLQELGEYLDPPVGKSGVNHRLKKLSAMAEEIRG